MKNLHNKLTLILVLIFLSSFVFGQNAGHQIKATLKPNGVRGQVDVYLTADYANTTDYFTNIVIAFSVPSTTGTATVNTTVKMVNSQILSCPVASWAAQPRQSPTGVYLYPFIATSTGTTISTFSTTEFKIGTFEFNDATMNLATVSLIDNASGMPGNWASLYLELGGYEVEPAIRANRFYAGTNGTLATNGTSYSVSANSQIVLPVTLVSFTTAKAGTGVNLNWLVTSETNAKGYDVERSSGNGADFTLINHVAANNNGKYSSVDSNPLSGGNYYRLKMIDADGKFTYSEVRTVLFDGTTVLFDIYPNPIVTNNLNLHLQQQNYAGKAQTIITDIAGRSIQSSAINIVKGNNELLVTVKTLNSGTYFVTIYDAKGNVISDTKKLVKQ